MNPLLRIALPCALFVAALPALPAAACAHAGEPLPQRVLRQLDGAEEALAAGLPHAAAQDLREAALGVGGLQYGLPAGQHPALANDALALEAAALAVDAASLRRSRDLERVLLEPRAHLAGRELGMAQARRDGACAGTAPGGR